MSLPTALLLASHNPHKAREIEEIFHSEGLILPVSSLLDLGDREEIVEDGDTLKANALIKAAEGFRRHGVPSFADDTGLEVEALGGAPGVYTARYAGPQCSPEDNISKLLREMDGIPEAKRQATFKTVIALVLNKEEVYFFEGEVEGSIASCKRGTEGFGYDPVFIPRETGLTFAEMGEETKNKVSHRARATQKLIEFLKGY
ncbi:MAG: RdgB/HAM1 family non-canonical purine NTP pyrophosphatase [Porphyromonas sp.]|nr:RdgB/HAM1 family non-canonical purine NTP pyrophosphatase [Bacteroidales bacterium]MDD7559477.1 RdgB/HAM1 family non-canonical purine NTP pyrophosphatase [Bacteroidales bacterium]MDY3100130.1 RdgB/HAM1 family non-canonical purine NTP pyrophosphatase [Porphyromonas sp.]